MKNDAWFCMNCMAVRDLDIHARCDCCGSDSVTPATGKGYTGPAASRVSHHVPLRLIFHVVPGAIPQRPAPRPNAVRQTLELVL